MTLALKLGRRAPIRNAWTVRSALALARALDPLGTAPTSSDDYVTAVDKVTKGNWGVYLNDQLGDCVIADCAHQVMLHSANGGTIVIPTNAQVLRAYEIVGGYVPGKPSTDQGCVEQDACQYLMTSGLAGVKTAGTGYIEPTNLNHIRWAVQLFGACRLGIMVTSQMMQAFGAGQPWTVFTGTVEGGHDIPIVKYDATYAYVVTWGRLQAIAWSLLANASFLDEAHAEVWPAFVRASGAAPNGFNLKQLLADLPRVTAPLVPQSASAALFAPTGSLEPVLHDPARIQAQADRDRYRGIVESVAQLRVHPEWIMNGQLGELVKRADEMVQTSAAGGGNGNH